MRRETKIKQTAKIDNIDELKYFILTKTKTLADIDNLIEKVKFKKQNYEKILKALNECKSEYLKEGTN